MEKIRFSICFAAIKDQEFTALSETDQRRYFMLCALKACGNKKPDDTFICEELEIDLDSWLATKAELVRIDFLTPSNVLVNKAPVIKRGPRIPKTKNQIAAEIAKVETKLGTLREKYDQAPEGEEEGEEAEPEPKDEIGEENRPASLDSFLSPAPLNDEDLPDDTDESPEPCMDLIKVETEFDCVEVELIDDDNFVPAKTQSKKDDIPYHAIMVLFNDIMPAHIHACRKLGPELKKQIDARWTEDKERQNLDWWEGFFKHLTESDFLMGRSTNFAFTLLWCTCPKNMEKILSGNYHPVDKHKAVSIKVRETVEAIKEGKYERIFD
jgi:hypothetical protein